MPSPLAHGMIGLSMVLARLMPARFSLSEIPTWLKQNRLGICLLLGMALAPDMDYIPGLFRGDLNASHQGVTHSLGWVLMLTTGVWLLGKAWNQDWGAGWWVWLCLAGCSHLVADLCTVDLSEPQGIALFWPFVDWRFNGPVFLFLNFEKEDWSQILQRHNFFVLAFELLLTFPVVLMVGMRKMKKSPHLVTSRTPSV